MRYGTVTLRQAGGHGVGVTDDPRVGPARPFVLAPHRRADACFQVRVRVTGPARGTLSGCRFRYRWGAVEHPQDVGCETDVRLGPSLGGA
ncbi:hypothetical protein [Streptomyces sp. NPDC017673]|uniref:hypothetical protein n=1 Tax=unclassified Streptomyces TaxID=2593676 RepID=UPI00378A1DFC